jgi:hypothetical protein
MKFGGPLQNARIDDLVKSKISPSRLGVTGGDEGEGDK